jgi:hypothetical protein
MPIILTREYLIAVVVAIVVAAVAKRAGLRGGLWSLSTVVIIITLWALGLNPLGFAVSVGGWIMFLATVLVGRVVKAIVTAVI